MDRQDLARETANKLTKLLIARRDVKAVEVGKDWFAKKSKMELKDFENHLFTKNNCMGTYLLNKNSKVKFVAFDIDLTGPGPYFVIRDLPELEAMEAAGDYAGELDPDIRLGMWDDQLHDPEAEGYRWVRSALSYVVHSLCAKADADLGLPALPVITGGGAHVLVPFGASIPASEARAIGHGLMDGLAGFSRTSDNFYTNAPDPTRLSEESHRRPIGETMSIEVFPKQDRLPGPDSYGNLIRLPFGWHTTAKMRTYIMDLDITKVASPWELPKAKSLDALDAALDRLGLNSRAS